MSYQQLTLIGNLGGDVETRYTQNGTAIANFSLATNRSYKDREGEKVSETTWYRVTVWGRSAETIGRYIGKGSRVLVEGRLVPDEKGNPRIWERKDGTPAASFDVSAFNVQFLDPPKSSNGHSEEHYTSDQMVDDDFDEIPF